MLLCHVSKHYISNVIFFLEYNSLDLFKETIRSASKFIKLNEKQSILFFRQKWLLYLQYIGDGLWERRKVVEHGLAMQVGGGKGVVAIA